VQSPHALHQAVAGLLDLGDVLGECSDLSAGRIDRADILRGVAAQLIHGARGLLDRRRRRLGAGRQALIALGDLARGVRHGVGLSANGDDHVVHRRERVTQHVEGFGGFVPPPGPGPGAEIAMSDAHDMVGELTEAACDHQIESPQPVDCQGHEDHRDGDGNALLLDQLGIALAQHGREQIQSAAGKGVMRVQGLGGRIPERRGGGRDGLGEQVLFDAGYQRFRRLEHRAGIELGTQGGSDLAGLLECILLTLEGVANEGQVLGHRAALGLGDGLRGKNSGSRAASGRDGFEHGRAFDGCQLDRVRRSGLGVEGELGVGHDLRDQAEQPAHDHCVLGKALGWRQA